MNIANVLSYSRFFIIAVAWIFAYFGNNFVVGVLLLVSGLTDFFDGFLARKLGIATEFGAKLDFYADQVVNVSLIFWIFMLLSNVYFDNKIFVLSVIGVYLLSLILGQIMGFLKKKSVSLHLYSMKTAMLVAYLFFIHALIFGYNALFLYLVGSIVIFGSLEEIYAALFTNSSSNTKSVFFK